MVVVAAERGVEWRGLSSRPSNGDNDAVGEVGFWPGLGEASEVQAER